MRISRRPSRGRGEYEVSENYNELTPRDLIDRVLVLDMGGGWRFDTGTRVALQGGKARLRLLQNDYMQLHRQIAAALLMPHPVRSVDAMGSGKPILKSDRYAIEHIELSHVALIGTDRALLSIDDITLRNYNLQAELLGFSERLQQLRYVWQHAAKLPKDIAQLLATHEQLVTSGQPVPVHAETIVKRLQNTLTDTAADFGILYRQGGEDVLPDLLHTLEWTTELPEPDTKVDEVAQEEPEIRQRVVGEWKRWANSRGAASAKFRQEVREAYNWTCIVCGTHLPRTSFNPIAGVDAAHILPWAEYELDRLSNGLCLCRQHHWAFDVGLIVISWNGSDYVIDVPVEKARGILSESPAFSIDDLTRYAGPIPEARLPKVATARPSQRFLELLNQNQ